MNYQNNKYHSARIIDIQELSVNQDRKISPLILPILESYIETKPKFIGEKYSLLSNLTALHRREGLQYRRLSFIPEIKLISNLEVVSYFFQFCLSTFLDKLLSNYFLHLKTLPTN